MQTTIVDILSKALVGKDIKVTDEFGLAWSAHVEAVKSEASGLGDADIYVYGKGKKQPCLLKHDDKIELGQAPNQLNFQGT